MSTFEWVLIDQDDGLSPYQALRSVSSSAMRLNETLTLRGQVHLDMVARRLQDFTTVAVSKLQLPRTAQLQHMGA